VKRIDGNRHLVVTLNNQTQTLNCLMNRLKKLQSWWLIDFFVS